MKPPPPPEDVRPPCAGCGHTTERGVGPVRMLHCTSPTCTWWRCPACKAINDITNGLWLPGNGTARPEATA